jgi:hypothetical protein
MAPESASDFPACLNVRGLYDNMRFVLRLSPKIHRLIDAVPAGLYASDELDGETIQAFSTYLHETVHWWGPRRDWWKCWREGGPELRRVLKPLALDLSAFTNMQTTHSLQRPNN